MSQGLKVLQPYLEAMRIFRYDAKDKKRLGKRRNEGWLERAVEKNNSCFFPSAGNPSASVVTIALSVNRSFGR